MSAAAEYEELHELVDRLQPDQTRGVLRVLRDAIEHPERWQSKGKVEPKHRPRLSFTGVGASGRGDLSERVDDYLSDGFGHS